jgi:hypothetical protein
MVSGISSQGAFINPTFKTCVGLNFPAYVSGGHADTQTRYPVLSSMAFYHAKQRDVFSAAAITPHRVALFCGLSLMILPNQIKTLKYWNTTRPAFVVFYKMHATSHLVYVAQQTCFLLQL